MSDGPWLTATAKAVEQGADTSGEVARVLHWTRHERRFDDLAVVDDARRYQRA